MERDESGQSRSIPLAKVIEMEHVGSLVLVLELHDDFDGDINDIV